jgi:hypothetical protein
MSNQAVSVYAEALKRSKQENHQSPAQESAQDAAHSREQSRDLPRINPREVQRNIPRKTTRSNVGDLPTRDEIQHFSFTLRDEFTAKVQAHVPYQWQGELEKIATKLNVKKLELYRYIIGEFLGKIKRERAT